MRSFKSDPYLWVHLAGLAAVPLLAELLLLGFSLGSPLGFFWLELLLVALVGLTPIFLMQWFKPFNIFSLLFICLKPEVLTEQQLKILTLFKSKTHRVLTIVGVIVTLTILLKIYPLAPIAKDFSSFLPPYRILGLAIASIAFLLINLFVMVPLSVIGVLFTRKEQFAPLAAYSTGQIKENFTTIGLAVKKILPEITSPETMLQDTIPTPKPPTSTET